MSSINRSPTIPPLSRVQKTLRSARDGAVFAMRPAVAHGFAQAEKKEGMWQQKAVRGPDARRCWTGHRTPCDDARSAVSEGGRGGSHSRRPFLWHGPKRPSLCFRLSVFPISHPSVFPFSLKRRQLILRCLPLSLAWLCVGAGDNTSGSQSFGNGCNRSGSGTAQVREGSPAGDRSSSERGRRLLRGFVSRTHGEAQLEAGKLTSGRGGVVGQVLWLWIEERVLERVYSPMWCGRHLFVTLSKASAIMRIRHSYVESAVIETDHHATPMKLTSSLICT
eukprot:1664230-Rhodomonas_salina.1